MNRRGILRMLGAAPIAAPVIAREAAAKASIGSLSNASGISMGYGNAIAGIPAMADNGWIRDHIVKHVLTKAYEDEIERDVAREPLRLDPDLASSRAFSLSTAMRLQREREVARRIASGRAHWLAQFKRATGTDWIPDTIFGKDGE